MGELDPGPVDAYVAALRIFGSSGPRPRPRWFRTLPALVLGAATLIAGPAPIASAGPAPFTGVSVRQASTVTVTDSSVDHAAHPELNLVSPMVPWQALEPQDGVFDFSQLDADVHDAATNGYRLMLRIMAGRLVPPWLLASGTQTLQVLGTDPNANDYCDWINVVVPWDATLEAQYREMMAAVGAWLSQDDGMGGTNADHVSLIPISMPTLLGSEMQIGFGTNVTCPTGTDGAGQSLSGVNSVRWHTLGTNEQLRAWTETAWHQAIAIHLQELPGNVRSVIAYGALFGDAQAAALRIAQSEIGPNRDRLWSMYTNLQPNVVNGAVTGVWKDWCPQCHDTIMAALSAGGSVGFQVAGTDRMDTHEEFTTAVEDAMPRYAMRFLEASPAALERELDYLLTGSDPVQTRLAAMAGQVLSTTSVSCTAVEAGATSTCTASVNELWDDPALVPGGDVTWNAGVAADPPTCALDANGSCSVSVTPASSGQMTVGASYAGDASHLASTGSTVLATLKRPSTVSLGCSTPVVTGQASACTATVSDAGTDGQVVAPTGSIAWNAVGAGSFSASSCTPSGTGGEASCAVTFTPSASGAATITATYGGSAIHQGGAASADVTATLRGTTTAVACSPTTLAVGWSATCTATVSDAAGAGASGPAGTVSWSTTGGGSFGAATCTLGGSGASWTCSVTYTTTATGGATITGAYGGSAVHAPGSGSAGVSVVLRSTTTSVACSPSSVATGQPSTCTVTVADAAGAAATGPTGTVAWTTSGSGSFSAASCTLGGSGTSTTCAVSYTATGGGSHTITATYGGDTRHAGSQGSRAITATMPDTTAPVVNITSPTNGGSVAKGKTVTIAASASDDRGVVRVEFRVNGVLKCTDTTSPYTCAWAVPKQANVTSTITATAYDAAGNVGTASITVKSR